MILVTKGTTGRGEEQEGKEKKNVGLVHQK
jgi:hypothetical protein